MKLTGPLLIVTTGLLLGRFAGLMRELSIAATLGLSREADLSLLAISIPDLLNTLFIGGAVSSVVVPRYQSTLSEQGPEEASRFFWQFVLVVAGGTCLLAAGMACVGPWLVGVLAPGLADAHAEQGVRLVRIVLIGFPLASATAVSAAVLQARRRVAMPAFGTLVFNVVLVAAILGLLSSYGLSVIAWAVVVAAAVRLVCQYYVCWTEGLFQHKLPSLFTFDQLDLPLIRSYVQALAAVGLVVYVPVIARAFASHVEGGMASFNYAHKLVELPVGLAGAVISMVIFPAISNHLSAGRCRQGKEMAAATGSAAFAASVAGTVFLVAGCGPIVTLLFQRGNLNANEAELIAQLGQIAFLALPACVLLRHATVVFHACQNTRFPFWGSVLVGPAFAITAWYASTHWNLTGIVVSLCATYWCYALMMIVGLKIKQQISVVGDVKLWRLVTSIAVSFTCIAIGVQLQGFTDNPLLQVCFATMLGGTCLVLLVLSLDLRGQLRDARQQDQDAGTTEPHDVHVENSRRMAA